MSDKEDAEAKTRLLEGGSDAEENAQQKDRPKSPDSTEKLEAQNPTDQQPGKDDSSAADQPHVDSTDSPNGTREDRMESPERPQKHVVKEGETLSSIAAALDVTPSHLLQFNKKFGGSRMVFPGMVLNVPPKEDNRPVSDTPPRKHQPGGAQPAFGSPARRILVKKQMSNFVEKPEILEVDSFVSVNARLITDGRGIVHGDILFSRHSLHFQPNTTDPLVAENDDADRFRVVAPSDLVANVAIFKDFGSFRSTSGIASKEEDKGNLFNIDSSDEVSNEPSPDPLYLRLAMCKPVGKLLPRDSPVLSLGEQALEPEYWFMVQSKSAEKLIRYVQRNFEGLYGLLDHMALGRRRMELIQKDRRLFQGEAGQTVSRETVAQMIRRLPTMDLDSSSPMLGVSTVLQDGPTGEERTRLAAALPAAVYGHAWNLAYNTADDGFSLGSLYRKLADCDGPVLLLLESMEGAAFGAYLTTAPRVVEQRFLGSGDTFVFTMRPVFQKYGWTGVNDYFIRAEPRELLVGLSDGRAALWVDGDLNRGRSEKCDTFDNEPLAGSEDFTIKTLESWTFTLV